MNVEIIGTVNIRPQEVTNNDLEPRNPSRIEEKCGAERAAERATVTKTVRSTHGEELPTTSSLSGNVSLSPIAL